MGTARGVSARPVMSEDATAECRLPVHMVVVVRGWVVMGWRGVVMTEAVVMGWRRVVMSIAMVMGWRGRVMTMVMVVVVDEAFSLVVDDIGIVSQVGSSSIVAVSGFLRQPGVWYRQEVRTCTCMQHSGHVWVPEATRCMV